MEKIKVKKKNLLAYIIMTLSFMGSCSVFQGTAGTLQWAMFYYGGPLVLLVLSMYCVLKNRSVRITKQRRFFLGLFCLPRIIMLGYSCIVWCITKPAFPYISRGISNTLFQCVAYFCGVCIVCSEKDDILKVSMASSVTVFVMTYLMGFVQNGVVFFRALNPLDEAADNFRKYTELHELAYIVGMCILMNLIVGKYTSLKKTNALFWASCVVFVIAWKRIGILAVAMTYLYFVVFSRSKRKDKSFFVRVTGIIGTIVCLVYVSLIVSGAFVASLKSLGIDMMGRDIIYGYFRKFANFSPAFFGKGVGFVGRQFDYTTREDLYNMVSIRALHNDFLKMYIDLGFVGFCLWVFWWLLKMPKILQKRYGIKKTFVCLLFVLYAFVLYTTDNAEGYTYFQMQLSAFITYICCFYDEQKTRNKILEFTKKPEVVSHNDAIMPCRINPEENE